MKHRLLYGAEPSWDKLFFYATPSDLFRHGDYDVSKNRADPEWAACEKRYDKFLEKVGGHSLERILPEFDFGDSMLYFQHYADQDPWFSVCWWTVFDKDTSDRDKLAVAAALPQIMVYDKKRRRRETRSYGISIRAEHEEIGISLSFPISAPTKFVAKVWSDVDRIWYGKET